MDFETIVVDNGSSDGSADMAEREFGARVIRNRENRGFCAANNQGIAAARGEFVALLNNDAEAEPDWLAALQRACASRPEIGMAASKVLVWEDPARIDKAGHLMFPDGQNRGRGSGALDRGQFDREEEVLWPDGCAAMYRKPMLDEIGGFDEDFFAYGDDAELGLRARIAGWRCLYAPRAVVRHHRGSTLGKDSGMAAATDRAQSRAAGGEAVSLEPAGAQSVLLRVRAWRRAALLARGNHGDTAHFPGMRRQADASRARWSRGDLAALRLIPRMLRQARADRPHPAAHARAKCGACCWRTG